MYEGLGEMLGLITSVLVVGALFRVFKRWDKKRTAKATGTTIMDTETGRVQNVKPGDFI